MKGNQRRIMFAGEPAGPGGGHGHHHERKEHGRHLRLGRWGTIAGCLAVQLFAVVAVYAAHERFVTPRLRHDAAPEMGPEAAAEQGRSRLLVQEASSGLSLAGEAASRAGAALGSAVGIGGGSNGCKGCPRNCTVRLQEADQQVLQAEMDRIVKSLGDGVPWVQAASDAADPAELADKLARGDSFKPFGVAAQRSIVDQQFGPSASLANTPGVEDVHAELAKYSADMVAAMTLDTADAAARQRRTTAAELGLDASDNLDDLFSLPHRVDFLNQLHAEVEGREALKVCIAATVSADLWGVRREILPWLQYHTELGVTRFYLLYDGADPAAVELLSRIRHVRLMHLHSPWASAHERSAFEFYSQQAKQWAGQPGNYELMVKQGYGEQEALRLAEADGMDWLMHLDPDELLHPGGPSASITAVLARQPPHVPQVRFMNFEGQPEAGDLTNRFEQVTLFRVHKHFITPEAHYYRGKYKLGDNAVFLFLYANGKPAVRVGVGARQLGPHFFAGDPSPRWQTQENPRGEWRDVVSDDTVVLHYAYSYMSDVGAKANRSCPPSFLEAARQGDRSKIKQCFVIDFDADAYLAASAGRAAVEDFFFSRCVLSEGSRIKCRDAENANLEGWCTLSNIDRFKYLMEKIGLMRRIHAPQLVLRLHERAIQASMRSAGAGGGPTGPAANLAAAASNA